MATLAGYDNQRINKLKKYKGDVRKINVDLIRISPTDEYNTNCKVRARVDAQAQLICDGYLRPFPFEVRFEQNVYTIIPSSDGVVVLKAVELIRKLQKNINEVFVLVRK